VTHHLHGVGVQFNAQPNTIGGILKAVFTANHFTDTDKQKQYRRIHKLNTTRKKTNNAKYSKTKLPWFSYLLQHWVRKRDGLILQCPGAHMGHHVCGPSLYTTQWNMPEVRLWVDDLLCARRHSHKQWRCRRLCCHRRQSSLCLSTCKYTAPAFTNVILADRTNGRTVCLSSVQNVLWLNGASYSKSYYWQPTGSDIWEIDWYHNKWPWPLFGGRCQLFNVEYLGNH